MIRRAYYIRLVIRSIKGAATRQFIEQGKSKFSGLDTKLAVRRIALLNAATSLDELGKLSSVGLHKLKGDLREIGRASCRERVCLYV